MPSRCGRCSTTPSSHDAIGTADMVDHAIVIGIDEYARQEWRLRAAVRDARAFARWVTQPGAGRATPETLHLLLSPRSDDADDGGLPPHDPPTLAKLAEVLGGFSSGALGADA